MDLLSTRIDLDAIAHNTRLIKERVGNARLMAVVKADAYGHGSVEVASIMSANGADAFGVATLAEAVALRESGVDKPILAWIWSPEQDVTDALAMNIELGVPSLAHARALVEAAIPAKVCVKVETGLHRSGVDEAQWDEIFSLLRDTQHLTVTGVFSHLACADDPSSPVTDRQAAVFERAIARARDLGLEVPINHLCNSPGTLTRPDLHHDQVRVGIALYGLEPVAGRTHGLQPAMTWRGKVIVVKPIEAGEGTSYGLTWNTDVPGQLAVVPCGYADGLPRSFQDHLKVGIGGKLYPQVGRVCMDQIVVWLGDNEFAVAPDDEAIIFGTGGMSATELAEAAGTINYEIVCRPTGRTTRSYEGGVEL
ncbi:alanine racemase [Corynebacterium alimapuense]|uniref:Alanine racemase n=1 Tax=Corynebacterium alimapuense TaxID=1576874 RepID=A0A3M8K6Q5_9CORY|nr:alanine racemase [Corynebacterium alimapuense]RNE48846.1 alanine racemase [Corynebacterium alimapuense]